MANPIHHRGPDDEGVWIDSQAGIGLAHRRLSILDLSQEGHQPMISSRGRFVIAYNGEVYNYRDLRRELESIRDNSNGCAPNKWHSNSDTEVMLAAIEEWGLKEAVKKFVGMFAFALWDRSDRKLHLVRDRLGIKPLYFGWQGKSFLFGSELKAVKAHPDFKVDIDPNAVAAYMRFNYIPAPYSIYKGVYKLLPGHILSLSSSLLNLKPEPVPYWTVENITKEGIDNPFTGTEDEAVAELDILLKDAVKLRMISDVPLGAFLSGGIDSSLVVALMQSQTTKPVKTFSIGFEEKEYDEAHHAKQVSGYLGTEHTELYVSPRQAMGVIPNLPALYDEPFSDPSQIPTFLVSQLARQNVTVSLSGDGGDELFSGYKRYTAAQEIWKMVRWMTPFGRKLFSKGILSVPSKVYDRGLGWISPITGRYGRAGPVGDKLYKFAEAIKSQSPEQFYLNMISTWPTSSNVVLDGHEPADLFFRRQARECLPNFVQKMMSLDTVSYLPDDILTKLDRASMGVSLEARVPLLDHRVFEFAWKIPMSMKNKNGKSKWLLRQLLYKYVPKNLIERPKMGFEVPVGQWLKSGMREWAEDLLSEQSLREAEMFRPELIRKKWKEHLSGERNWRYCLWSVLMFQAWWQKEKAKV